MTTDPGLEALAQVRGALDPDPQWSVAGPRSFTWWPSTFAQRIVAGPGETLADGPAWRVRAELPLVRGVAGGARTFALLARWNAVRPGLSALRWNGDERLVSLHASVLVPHGAHVRAARMLAAAAVLQIADAARDGMLLARELEGVPVASSPPGRAPRASADPLLEAWRDLVGDAAALALAGLERAAAMDSPPWVRVHLDETGLHAEVPCAAAGEAPAGSAPGVGVALLHLLTHPAHPGLGAGLLAALSLPPEAEPVPGRAVSTVALLNEAEAREAVPFDSLGAWCVHPVAGLAFVSFLPARLLDLEAPAALAREFARRSAWARDFLARARPAGEAPAGGG